MTSYIPTQNVKFNKCLTGIEQHPDKVVLTFADGEIAEATVLAGADGIKSIVREHVLRPLHPSQVDPVYADAYCYRGVIPMSEAEEILGSLTDVAKIYMGPNIAAVTYRITGGEVRWHALRQNLYYDQTLTVYWRQEFNFLLCKATDGEWTGAKNAVTEKVSHEAMMADFQGPAVDERFQRLLSKAKPIKWGFFHHLHTSTYFRDRVALMGDSAHASLPFQAAGAAQGIEDALVLSNILAELKTTPVSDASLNARIRAAFDAYDSVRRPRAQKQLEQSAELARMIYFQDEKAGSDMTKILPRLQNGRFNWIWFHDIQEDVNKAVARMEK
jgi:salicylate hydroxylase